jgi:hypothetical protein
MLKRLTLAAVSAIFAICVLSAQPNKAANGKQSTADQSQASIVLAQPQKQDQTTSNKAESTPDSPQWYTPLKQPDGMLVIVGIITCLVIGWQSWETRKSARGAQKAAEAALLNTQVVINAERAWIVVDVESPAPGKFNFIAKNVGRTPAKVRSIWSSPIITKRGKTLCIPPDEQTKDSLIGMSPCLIPPTDTYTVLRCDIAELDKGNAFGVGVTFSQGFADLRFYGRIVYFDILQPETAIPHETKWLYWHIPIDGAMPFPDPDYPLQNTYT